MLPQPGTLRVGPPPYWPGLPGIVPIAITFTIAAGIVATSGLVLFGWYSIRVMALSVAATLLVESTFNAIKGRPSSWSESHALLVGVLFACTLPPTASWRVVLTGALVAILFGEALSGGLGNYVWHPVAVGRVAVQMLFYDELTPERWPVLGPGKLLWGNLDQAVPMPAQGTWNSHDLPQAADAWLVRPLEDLLRVAFTGDGTSPAGGLVTFIRDVAPPWRDTLTGVAGGAIGEACGAVILIAACLLIWRGFLRWPLIVASLAATIATAAILPVRIESPNGGSTWLAWPGWQSLPIGAAYVMYHLTASGVMFVALLLAPDPSSSPLTRRGCVWFGAIIGVLTVVLRGIAGLPAAPYWALLAANTMVPTINRLTRRRVFGT